MASKHKGPHVIVHKGNLTGRIYEITKRVITIGREVGNDILVNDVSISRFHARLICTDEHQPAFMLEDLGSTNGTFINGQALSGSAQEISFTDEIVLAHDVFLILKNGIFKPQDDTPIEATTTRQLDLRGELRQGQMTRPVDQQPFQGMSFDDLERISDALAAGEAGDRFGVKDSTQPDMPHVFISYSRIDSEVMTQVSGTFQAAGLRVWVDLHQLVPGEPSWRRAVQNAIDQAGCVVVILSPDAKNSKWVEAELDYAETQHKKIFCVLARGDRGSAALLGYTLAQWIDIRRDYDHAMQDLVTVIKKHVGLDERSTDEQVTAAPAGDKAEDPEDDTSI